MSSYLVANYDMIPLLIGLLKCTKSTRRIVFVNTKKVAEKVWSYLEGNEIHAAVLSGDVPQKKRQRLFSEFSTGDLKVLVATDLLSLIHI